MATTTLTIHIDDDLKEKAETIFNAEGLNVVSALQKFIEKCVNDGKIPNDALYSDPDFDDESFFSETNQAALDESIKQIEEGKVVIMTLDEVLALGE